MQLYRVSSVGVFEFRGWTLALHLNTLGLSEHPERPRIGGAAAPRHERTARRGRCVRSVAAVRESNDDGLSPVADAELT